MLQHFFSVLWRDSTIIIGQFFSVLFKMLLREEASFIEVTLLTKTYSLDYEFVEKRVKPGNQFSMRYGEC